LILPILSILSESAVLTERFGNFPDGRAAAHCYSIRSWKRFPSSDRRERAAGDAGDEFAGLVLFDDEDFPVALEQIVEMQRLFARPTAARPAAVAQIPLRFLLSRHHFSPLDADLRLPRDGRVLRELIYVKT
jgi:hypothetical protein